MIKMSEVAHVRAGVVHLFAQVRGGVFLAIGRGHEFVLSHKATELIAFEPLVSMLQPGEDVLQFLGAIADGVILVEGDSAENLSIGFILAPIDD